jgi:predicted nuclease of predicted toxin-antitoxin system
MIDKLIVADESVDWAIIKALRENNYQVLSIMEDHSGWPDEEVLSFAYELSAYLITEDKDFGELTYRLKRPSHGILLIRLISSRSDEKAALVLDVFQKNEDRLSNSFSVLDENKLRIKSF